MLRLCISTWWQVLLDIVSPLCCPLCNCNLSRNAGLLCLHCASQTQARLQNFLSSQLFHNRALFFSELFSLYQYSISVKELIIAFKEKNRRDLAAFFFNSVSTELQAMLVSVDIIAYVPLTRKKQLKRGYNQAKVLAEHLSKITGKSNCSLLACRSKAAVQKKLAYEGRFVNVQGIYCAKKNNLNNKTVLLVDDVVTTGATLNECARILKKMGAKSVFSLTIARVDIY